MKCYQRQRCSNQSDSSLTILAGPAPGERMKLRVGLVHIAPGVVVEIVLKEGMVVVMALVLVLIHVVWSRLRR